MRTYPKAALLSLFCLSAATFATSCVENTISKEKGTLIENPQAKSQNQSLHTSVDPSAAAALAQKGLDSHVDTKLGQLAQSQSAYDAINNATPNNSQPNTTQTPPPKQSQSAYDAINNATPSSTSTNSANSNNSSPTATTLTAAEMTRYNQNVEEATNLLIGGEFAQCEKLAQELVQMSNRVSVKDKAHYVGFTLQAACLAETGEKEKAKLLYQKQLEKAQANGVVEIVNTLKERLKEL